MRVALYLRVSTKEQTENYSLDNQLEKLESYCKAKDWTIYDTYKDGGFSGASTDRPDLKRLLSDIKNIDAVVVYKLDRLSRSQRDTLELIEEHFLKNEVNFVSVTESLDTSTPMGRAMIGIMSAFAQLERELIAERMRDGQIKRAQSGYAAMGGNYNPAGFKRIDGELVTDESEKEHIQEVFRLYAKYHSIAKVQQELKLKGHAVWRHRRYNDMLRNPLYNGKVTYASKVYEGNHEKIIDDELFNEVQRLLRRHRGRNFQKAKESLFSGMITCSCCGEKYVVYQSSHKAKDGIRIYRYYMCKARRFPAEYPRKCNNKNWRIEKLEEIIRTELQLLTVEKEKITDKEKKTDYTQLINNVNNRIERVVGLYADGNIDKEMLDEKIEGYNKEKDVLLKRKFDQEQELEDITPIDIEDYVIDLKKADFATKRAIIDKLVSQIYINNEDVTIEWNF